MTVTLTAPDTAPARDNVKMANWLILVLCVSAVLLASAGLLLLVRQVASLAQHIDRIDQEDY